MVLSCKEAVSCAEDAVQVRRRRCYYGPASDAEFLRSIADKTPGREDQDHMRRRQVYLRSYVFVTKDDEAPGGQSSPMLLRRRRKAAGRHHHGSSQQAATSSSISGRWCAKKKAAGKVLSHLLNRLLACTCNPASASSSSYAGAAADVHRHPAT